MRVLLFANTDWYLYNFRRSLMHGLVSRGHEVVLVSPPGDYGTKLREEGFTWLPISMDRRSLNPLREALLILTLSRLIRANAIDVVHGFTIKPAVYAAIAGRLGGARGSVNSVTGMGYVFTSEQFRARLLRPLVSRLLRAAFNAPGSRVIVQNPDDSDQLIRSLSIRPSNVTMIRGSGVDCSRFSPGVNGVKRVPMRVLLASRLLWDKGIAEYVDAARQLRQSGRDIEFLLAGRPDLGNPASVPESVILEWSREGLLRCLGHVEDMPSLLQSVHVVVLPSYREGLPKSLIEAAAAGLAIVTTNVPGCREVVCHEISGLLIPPKDVDALAASIARLYDEPLLRQELGTAARRRAIEEFDQEMVVRKTLDVYHELVPGVPAKLVISD